MAQRGHEVTLLLLSYRKEPRLSAQNDGLAWITESLYPAGPFPYVTRAKRLVEQTKPDWIVGFSDTYYGILAVMLARKYSLLSAIDAYDNYESYMPWLKPLHYLWRKAVAGATVVTAAGPHLAELLASFRDDKRAIVVPMAPDPDFYPMDRRACRKELGLPVGKKIVGCAGSLFRNRGVERMFEAFEILRSQDADLHFVLTGRRERGLFVPGACQHFGYLPDHLVPKFVNSLDVLIVPNRVSAFGSFSYPVKLYEGMNCRIPVVATETGPTKWILGNRKQFLAASEDPLDLATKTRRLLPLGRVDYGYRSTWNTSSERFERALQSKSDSAELVKPEKTISQRWTERIPQEDGRPENYSRRRPEAVYSRAERETKARKILAVIRDSLSTPLDQLRVLDLGCASGIITSFLCRHFRTVIGLDIDREALTYATRTKALNADFMYADALRLPFPAGSFDVVICAHVYEHVVDSKRLMDEIHRVLKNEGSCFFAAGNKLRLMEPHYRLPLLSVLPAPLADRYLAISGKGSRYREKHLTYWGLKRLVSGFEVFDYTTRIIQYPIKYAATDLCSPGSLKQKMAFLFLRLAYGFAPTYIFLLRKTPL
jgi:2-polyprenyl-3-methyl-5-hydroxy-6-metoxy-1,4-benzoquinol methylase/glycosyltransferase involved in cell wall biosynthesis